VDKTKYFFFANFPKMILKWQQQKTKKTVLDNSTKAFYVCKYQASQSSGN
jgi:hypothetical protein